MSDVGIAIFGKRNGLEIFRSDQLFRQLTARYPVIFNEFLQLKLEEISLPRHASILSFVRLVIDNSVNIFYTEYSYVKDSYGRDGYIGCTLLLRDSFLKPSRTLNILSDMTADVAIYVEDSKISTGINDMVLRFLDEGNIGAGAEVLVSDTSQFKPNSRSKGFIQLDKNDFIDQQVRFLGLPFLEGKVGGYGCILASENDVVKESIDRHRINIIPNDILKTEELDFLILGRVPTVVSGDVLKKLEIEYEALLDEKRELVAKMKESYDSMRSRYDHLLKDYEDMEKEHDELLSRLKKYEREDTKSKDHWQDKSEKKKCHENAEEKGLVSFLAMLTRKYLSGRLILGLASICVLGWFVVSLVQVKPHPKSGESEGNATRSSRDKLFAEVDLYLEKRNYTSSKHSSLLGRLQTMESQTNDYLAIEPVQEYIRKMELLAEEHESQLNIVDQARDFVATAKKQPVPQADFDLWHAELDRVNMAINGIDALRLEIDSLEKVQSAARVVGRGAVGGKDTISALKDTGATVDKSARGDSSKSH